MRRGRKPAPTELKILKGTRADRLNSAAPTPPAIRPEPPAHLDAIALEEWRRILPLVESMGVLAQVDGAALALYCDAHSQWVRANVEIESNGLTVETGMGGLKANPAVAIARAAKAQMHSLLSEFGATPSARSRLKTPADRKSDALGDFLASKRAR